MAWLTVVRGASRNELGVDAGPRSCERVVIACDRPVTALPDGLPRTPSNTVKGPTVQSLLHPELVRTFCSDKARQTPIQSGRTPAAARPLSRPRWSWAMSTHRLGRSEQPSKGQA
jgi:hypothetical protein